MSLDNNNALSFYFAIIALITFFSLAVLTGIITIQIHDLFAFLLFMFSIGFAYFFSFFVLIKTYFYVKKEQN